MAALKPADHVAAAGPHASISICCTLGVVQHRLCRGSSHSSCNKSTMLAVADLAMCWCWKRGVGGCCALQATEAEAPLQVPGVHGRGEGRAAAAAAGRAVRGGRAADAPQPAGCRPSHARLQPAPAQSCLALFNVADEFICREVARQHCKRVHGKLRVGLMAPEMLAMANDCDIAAELSEVGHCPNIVAKVFIYCIRRREDEGPR